LVIISKKGLTTPASFYTSNTPFNPYRCQARSA